MKSLIRKCILNFVIPWKKMVGGHRILHTMLPEQHHCMIYFDIKSFSNYSSIKQGSIDFYFCWFGEPKCVWLSFLIHKDGWNGASPSMMDSFTISSRARWNNNRNIKMCNFCYNIYMGISWMWYFFYSISLCTCSRVRDLHLSILREILWCLLVNIIH